MEKYNEMVGDHILISYFVRYEVLTEMINAEFYNSNYEKISNNGKLLWRNHE